MNLISDDEWKTVRVYVFDAYNTCGDEEGFTFVIPELKAHSTWSGAVTVAFDECGKTVTAQLSADLPWYPHTVECTSVMSCEPITCPPVVVPVLPVIDPNGPTCGLPLAPNKDDYFGK